MEPCSGLPLKKIASSCTTSFLAEIVFDFFDHLKSRTRGCASLDYHEWQAVADLVRSIFSSAETEVDAFQCDRPQG